LVTRIRTWKEIRLIEPIARASQAPCENILYAILPILYLPRLIPAPDQIAMSRETPVYRPPQARETPRRNIAALINTNERTDGDCVASATGNRQLHFRPWSPLQPTQHDSPLTLQLRRISSLVRLPRILETFAVVRFQHTVLAAEALLAESAVSDDRLCCHPTAVLGASGLV